MSGLLARRSWFLSPLAIYNSLCFIIIFKFEEPAWSWLLMAAAAEFILAFGFGSVLGVA